jgi:Na+/melibiose symporter-like transporter
MSGFFNYDSKLPVTGQILEGFRFCSSIVVGILFALCTVLLIVYKLNRKMTYQMADELAERRKKFENPNGLGQAT